MTIGEGWNKDWPVALRSGSDQLYWDSDERVQSVQLSPPNEKQQKVAGRKVFNISCSFLRALRLERDFPDSSDRS